MSRDTRDQRRGSWPVLLLLVLIGVAAQFAPWPSTWADAVFLRGTLPAWSSVTATVVTSVAGSVSVAVALALAIVVIVALLSGRGPRRFALRLVLWSVAISVAAFPFTFGLGYRTTALETRLGVDAATAGPELLPTPALASVVSIASESALEVLTESAAALGTAVPEAPDAQTPGEAAAACLSDYIATFSDAPRATIPDRVKALPAGWLLRFDFAGVNNPWLLEPHVDAGLPAASGLAVALHELAHTAGFAREAEAEAVALLAGMSCADARVRYAASLRAASSFAGELSPDARESYLSRWPAVATADVAAAAAATARFRSQTASELMTGIYDVYLTSQGAEEGLDDYARALTIVARVIGRDGTPRVMPR